MVGRKGLQETQKSSMAPCQRRAAGFPQVNCEREKGAQKDSRLSSLSSEEVGGSVSGMRMMEELILEER